MPNSIAENRDCMNAMRDFPDKFFELAVVDPPYGIGVTDNKSGMGRRKGDAKAKYKVGDWDSCIPNEFYFKELFRVSKQQIIWGGNYFTLPPSKCFLIWDKMFSNEVSFSAAEYAWASFDEMASIFKYHPGQPGRIHPTQKPVALYKWLLTNYAKPGDKILDTHLGSGSSRIAAFDMGFDFWGYELDADYFAAMEARFKEHISKPVLFAPDEMYNFEQGKLF
jgi:site-specific DNA-methyltransferase (adenine-specific)